MSGRSIKGEAVVIHPRCSETFTIWLNEMILLLLLHAIEEESIILPF